MKPTYIVVTSRRLFHLSDDGITTLCGRSIPTRWLRHDERIALFVVYLSGEPLCKRCEEAVQ